MSNDFQQTADFQIGPQSIGSFSRLSYTMWYALAEFVDNSTQSRMNYGGIIDDVLDSEKTPLKVEIEYDQANRRLVIKDNSIGMTKEKLIEALKIAVPTKDSIGRSKYGMGLKTAACWIGRSWSITTCEWDSGEEWTATVDVDEIVKGNSEIPLSMRSVPKESHGTTITIWNLHRTIQKRTLETIKIYLGSMYRVDIRNRKLILLVDGNTVILPDEFEFARTPDGNELREKFSLNVGGRPVEGWVGVLKVGSRKFGGFSLLQHDRLIRGYPDAWKPKVIFGGVEDEGSNTLVSQRLTGEIIMDGFDVSHTKDAILFSGDEEEELLEFLAQKTQFFKTYATTMRTRQSSRPWAKEKIEHLIEGIREEFSSAEVRDALNETLLPPLEIIEANNRRQVEDIRDADVVYEIGVGESLLVRVIFQDRSENDPYVAIVSASPNKISIAINERHPYYLEIDSEDRVDEIVRQYIYDAVSEYRIRQRHTSHQPPDAIREVKDRLLRAKIQRLENKDNEHIISEVEKLKDRKTSVGS